MNEYAIKEVRGHYEIYYNGRFMCSADTYLEAVRECEGIPKYQNKKE